MGCGGRALFHSAAAGGIDVATQGIASPPTSPPLRTVSPATAASKAKAPSKPVVGRKSRPAKGAAYTIAGECERLFCGALRAAFLGERSAALQNPLAVGVRKTTTEARDDRSSASMGGSSGTEDWGAGVHGPRAVKATSYPSPEPDGFVDTPKGAPLHGILESWVEVWDYVGGGRFRGFVASGTSCGNEGERILFIFLDEPSGEFDLRPGWVPLRSRVLFLLVR